MEHPFDVTERAGCSFVPDSRPHGLTADHTLKAHVVHQAFYHATCDGHALPHQLPPDLAGAMHLDVIGEDSSVFGFSF